jgi:allantoin racemase
VVNPNTSESMTHAIAQAARAAASAGTEILPLTAPFGVAGIDCNVESLISAVAVMDAVTRLRADGVTFDAVVLAGYGEHGREGLQEMLEEPVLDIAEVSAHAAMLLGRRFSVVTTLDRSISAIEDRLLLAGVLSHCASVRGTGLSTSELDADPVRAVAAVVEQARLAVQSDRAEVICLGCGGLAGAAEAVQAAVGVPVIDGVVVGVRFAEALVGAGLRTSKVGTNAPPPDQPVKAWPISANLREGVL